MVCPVGIRNRFPKAARIRHLLYRSLFSSCGLSPVTVLFVIRECWESRPDSGERRRQRVCLQRQTDGVASDSTHTTED